MKICMRYWISGRVQGVWYRAATQQQAEQLALTGYARNLPDGRVEVLACGEEQAVAILQNWLWQGPPQARVTAVESELLSHQSFSDFTIR
ncbi:MAG: acylphosphatase [Gammaproteobacteria bacterium]